MDSSGAVIGTPDDAVERIIRLQQLSGGFGAVLAFGHCWTTREQTLRTYDLLARYVIQRNEESRQVVGYATDFAGPLDAPVQENGEELSCFSASSRADER